MGGSGETCGTPPIASALRNTSSKELVKTRYGHGTADITTGLQGKTCRGHGKRLYLKEGKGAPGQYIGEGV